MFVLLVGGRPHVLLIVLALLVPVRVHHALSGGASLLLGFVILVVVLIDTDL